jgi:chromosome segregation ATPase
MLAIRGHLNHSVGTLPMPPPLPEIPEFAGVIPRMPAYVTADRVTRENIALENRLSQEVGERSLLQRENRDLIHVANEERRRAAEMSKNLEFELKNEMAMRGDLQLRIKELVEEVRRRDVEILDLRSANEVLLANNRSLATEMSRLRLDCEGKETAIKNLEEKLRNVMDNAERQYRDYVADCDRQRYEHDHHLDSIKREYNGKIQQLEDKCKHLLVANDEFQRELVKVHSEMEADRQGHLQDMKRVEHSVVEEQERRHLGPMRDLEMRLRTSEESRDLLEKRIEDIFGEMNARERNYREAQNQYESEINRLRMENERIRNEQGNSSLMIEKLRVDLGKKEASLSQLKAELQECGAQILRIEEISKSKIDAFLIDHNSQVATWETNEERLKRRLFELEELLRDAESEITFLRGEYKRLIDMLQQNLNQTIFETLTSRSGVLPERVVISQRQMES